jgi:hypothetical protein
MYVQYGDTTRWSSRVARLTGLTTIAPDSTPNVGDVSTWWTNVNLGIGPTSWWVGIPVDKVGRTTGWSRGKLGYTCVDETFNVPGSLALTHTILCNDIIVPDTLSGGVVNVPYSGGGDSGGPVFISNNNAFTELKALGIMVGTRFEPYAVILDNNFACTASECWTYYNRISRIKMYVHAPF